MKTNELYEPWVPGLSPNELISMIFVSAEFERVVEAVSWRSGVYGHELYEGFNGNLEEQIKAREGLKFGSIVVETKDKEWISEISFRGDSEYWGEAILSPEGILDGHYIRRHPGMRAVKVRKGWEPHTGEASLYFEYRKYVSVLEKEPGRVWSNEESLRLWRQRLSSKWEFYRYYCAPGGGGSDSVVTKDPAEWDSFASFEEPEHYLPRGAVKKISRDLVQRYCERLGIRLTDADFYEGRFAIIGRPLRKGE